MGVVPRVSVIRRRKTYVFVHSWLISFSVVSAFPALANRRRTSVPRSRDWRSIRIWTPPGSWPANSSRRACYCRRFRRRCDVDDDDDDYYYYGDCDAADPSTYWKRPTAAVAAGLAAAAVAARATVMLTNAVTGACGAGRPFRWHNVAVAVVRGASTRTTTVLAVSARRRRWRAVFPRTRAEWTRRTVRNGPAPRRRRQATARTNRPTTIRSLRRHRHHCYRRRRCRYLRCRRRRRPGRSPRSRSGVPVCTGAAVSRTTNTVWTRPTTTVRPAPGRRAGRPSTSTSTTCVRRLGPRPPGGYSMTCGRCTGRAVCWNANFVPRSVRKCGQR